MNTGLRFLVVTILAFAPGLVLAQGELPLFNIENAAGEKQTYSVTLHVLAAMTVLTLLPSLLLTMTSFTRIIIVFSILRQAIGLAQTPSNQILIGLALFLSFFTMAPFIEKAYTEAIKPYMEEKIPAEEALTKVKAPFQDFMTGQTRVNDLNLFVRLSNEEVTSEEDVPFFVLLPAFVTSELKTAFQIGFLLFIPFLIIDLVVASLLMAMGMMMLSPLIISLPFKIMLFVLVDGWALVVTSLARSFGV